MYDESEYKEKRRELIKMAAELFRTKDPESVRKIASEMNSEDAYIFGIGIGVVMTETFRNQKILHLQNGEGSSMYV